MSLPKKKINEIKARLLREPAIREVYVEGIFDRDLLRWILKNLGLSDVKVYPISTVEVPNDLLEKLGFTLGERQRVQAAARLLECEPTIHNRILFFIDADLDYLLGKANYAPPLQATTGTSAELLLWKKDILQKFISMGLGCENPEGMAEKLMSFVEPIVGAVCIFRAAKELLGASWKLINIRDSFDRKNAFSFENYCNKVGDKNGARKYMNEHLQTALKTIEERANSLSSDKKIHGHDLMAAMAKKLQIDGYNQKCLENSEEFSRLLMSSLEWDHVREDETIAKIRAVFTCP